MVQEIPEEFYNLTKLAEVTLAASKLSTTNVNQIRDYIQKEVHDRVDTQQNKYSEKNAPYVHLTNNYHNHHNENNYQSYSDNSSDFDDKILHASTKKKWKHNWETFNLNKNETTESEFNRDYAYQQKDLVYTNLNEQKLKNNNFVYYYSSNEHLPTTTTLPVAITTSHSQHNAIRDQTICNYEEKRRSSLTSTSDDDSTFSYSHKIFDRKKSRNIIVNVAANSVDAGLKNREIYNDVYDGDDEHLVNCDDNVGLDYETNNNFIGRISEKSSPEDIHICPECGKKYSTSSNLARHRQTHRSLQDKKARRCPHCDKVYVSIPAFSMHVRTHNQGCKCLHCGKCFSRPWLLQGHIRTHTGEKPFKCNVCLKSFADKSNLRAHVQTHSNSKPHFCGRCGKSFALKSYLYKHEESSCIKNYSKTSVLKEKPRNPLIRVKKESEFETTKQKKPYQYGSSSLVREKIREVLVDNQKKSYINLTNLVADNRISVIRTSVIAQNFTSPDYHPETSLKYCSNSTIADCDSRHPKFAPTTSTYAIMT